MYDESYIHVQAWDDQTGQWYTVDEASNADNAREIIAQRKNDGKAFGITSNWSILYVQRTIV